MEKTKNHEKMSREVIKLCSDFKFPGKPKFIHHIYKRTKILNESKSEYLKDLANLQIFKVLRHFLTVKEKDIRTTTLKIFRYLCNNAEDFQILHQSHIEHFLIRSFELEGHPDERIESCKLIRVWLEHSSASLPKSIINSLVSLSESENDELKEFGIESIRYLSTLALDRVVWSGGMRVLISSTLDLKCSQALSENIVLTLNYLLNEEKSRSYLKNGQELTRIFAVFTDYESGLKENELEATIKLARRFLVSLVKAWPGLIYLISSGFHQVVTTLKFPVKAIIKEGILETLLEMVSIPVDSSAKYFNVLNNYLAMLVKGLLHCGLYPALTHCALDKNSRIAHRARSLLKLITKVASDLLPESPQVSLNLIAGNEGKTAELVAEIANSARIRGVAGDKNFLKEASDFISYDVAGGLGFANLVLVGIYRQHFLNSLDDTQYLNLIGKSQVSREIAKWEWNIIYEILSGPISIPLRFIHPQSQKFLKNLVGYFMPSKGLFSGLSWHPSHFIKSRVGSLLISLLLSQEEGISLLSTTYSESFFVVRKSYMGELNDALEEEIKYEETQTPSAARVFTEEKVKKCMAREYLRWIGIFLSSRSGKKLLKTYNIDSKVMKLSQIDHLAPVLLTILDFKDESSQQFLNLMLQAKSKLLRLKAIESLRGLFRSGNLNLSWSIWGLKNLLHSSDNDSVSASIQLLDELCQYKENLLTLIDTGPQILVKLAEQGNQVLIRFLSCSKGVQYLSQMDYIQQELAKWDQSMNLEYTHLIEEKVMQGLSASKKLFSLTIVTPKVFQFSERLQLTWISKLPLSICVSAPAGKHEVDTVLELDKEDVYLVGYCDSLNISSPLGLSTCLLLGQNFIDSKGNEIKDGNYVKCPKDAPPAGAQPADGCSLEASGVSFLFTAGLGKLVKVSFRLQVLPRGVPALQIPRHLFGELGKTAAGIEILAASRHIETYIGQLFHAKPVNLKRAWVWAMGHTGGSNYGAGYLAKTNGIAALIKLAETSTVLSLRGTAAQALSLVARSPLGRGELKKFDWVSSDAYSSSIAVPEKAEKFFWIEKKMEVFSFDDECSRVEKVFDGILLSDLEKDVFRHVCLLGSLMNKSSSEQFLRNLRNNAPGSFLSRNLFHAVMTALAGFSFKLSTRRVIHKLFERAYRMENLQELDGFTYI